MSLRGTGTKYPSLKIAFGADFHGGLILILFSVSNYVPVLNFMALLYVAAELW